VQVDPLATGLYCRQ